MIDARKISSVALMKKFYDSIESKVILDITGMTLELTKNDFIYKLFNEKEFAPEDTSVISLKSENDEMLLTGYDYNWWNATRKRQEKMLAIANGNESTVKTKKAEIAEPVKSYSIGVATLYDSTLHSITYAEGSKEDCIDFINKELIRRHDFNNAQTTVINLCFDKAEYNVACSSEESKAEYCKKLDFWYDLNELAQMGAIQIA